MQAWTPAVDEDVFLRPNFVGESIEFANKAEGHACKIECKVVDKLWIGHERGAGGSRIGRGTLRPLASLVIQ